MSARVLLLAILLITNSLLNASVISDYEKRDLEIFGSMNNTHAGLLGIIDRTQTSLGKKQLHKLLEHVTCLPDILIPRQKFVHYLLNNKPSREKLQKNLAIVHEHEDSLAQFLVFKNSKLQEKTFSSLYFNQKILRALCPKVINWLNESSTALTLSHYLPIDLVSPVLEVIIFHVFAEKIQDWFKPKEKHSHPEHECHDHEHHHGHGNHHHEHEHKDGHAGCAACNMKAPKGAPLGVKIAARSLQALHFLIHASAFNESLNNTIKRHELLAFMHLQILNLRHCLDAMKEIERIISDIQNDLKLPFSLPKTIVTNDIDIPDEMGTLSNVGAILTSHKKLLASADQIQELSDFTGRVDAYVSMANLVEEHQERPQHFCFAQFAEHSPIIHATKMWNPMLSANTAVANDIHIAENKESKLIITGPNKAGKSSLIKAVGLNVVLAQTFGIAAADTFFLSPLKKLITYIHLSDDITQEQSSFVAEMVRADACLKDLEKYKDEPTLMIIDDSLFKSTNYKQGQQLAFDFIKALGKHPNAMILVATHFPMLTQLPNATNGVFSNYHIEVIEDESGKKESSYQLKPGADKIANAFALVANQHTMTFA